MTSSSSPSSSSPSSSSPSSRAPSFSLAGKRFLVTGGTRGVGLELARQATALGAEVAITYAHRDDDAELAREAIAAAGTAPLVYKGTTADRAHIEGVVKELVGRWGRIDGLAAAAAINQMYPLALLDEKDWDDVLATNLKGAFLVGRAVAKHMIKARAGSILFFGSFASERVIESPAHYAASKSGLRGLTEAMALEVGRYGVRVNLVAPGILETGLSSMLPQHRLADYLGQTASGRVATAAEIAATALFLLSDESTFVTGAKLVLDGGL